MKLPTRARRRARAYTALGYLYQAADNAAGTVFWTANARDAELHLLTQTQGNGVTTTEAFNLATGLVQSILAGTGNAISNQTFTFDPLGNLTARTWLNGGAGVKENACYDGLNRLTSTLVTSGAACTGAGAITAAYDALGNITQKSDVCATANCFVYGGSGAGPHALTSIIGTYNGVTNPSFLYDANGLMTAGAGRTVTATTFDMAASIVDGSNSAAFSYDSEHARYKMVITGVNAGTTYYLNDPSGAMEEKAVVSGQTNWRDYILAGGKLVAERVCVGAEPCTASPTLTYFVLDHLGSVAVIVSSTGTILNQLGYDAWGKRRNPDGSAINCVAGTAPPAGVTRGFTGQEMIDGLCLVNLNARVYDPAIGRFMAADPTVGDETQPQELNRFTYVLDNPLSLTDPSGLCFAGCFWRSALFRDVLGIAVAIVLEQPWALSFIDGELGIANVAAGELAVINGGIVGGISGVVSTGTLKGAALGALQGGLFAEAGNFLKVHPAGFLGIGHVPSEFLAHGLVGGLVSEASGGRFTSGFLAGGISSLAPAPTPGQSADATFRGVVISAVLGGAGSELGGGKFANGAVTGAFGYLFNACLHNACWTTRAEASLARQGNFLGYYKLGCADGDTYDCAAYHIAANDSLAGNVATTRLVDALQAAGQSTSNATLNTIRLDLAQSYALYYLPQSQSLAFQPSALDIAAIHWLEFGYYGLPSSTFGGTPFGSWAAETFGTVGAKDTWPYWCTGCKR